LNATPVPFKTNFIFCEKLTRLPLDQPIMKKLLALSFISCALLKFAQGQAVAPKPISPDSAQFSSAPGTESVHAVWLVGAAGKPGLYIVRVRIKANTTIPPHTHPDERSTIILSGTVYVGFGEVFDPGKAVAVRAGSVYVVPANMPHYISTKDGNAIYQETGYGPTASKLIGAK
jgi:quercetin dioxygenase-like cupin family protein